MIISVVLLAFETSGLYTFKETNLSYNKTSTKLRHVGLIFQCLLWFEIVTFLLDYILVKKKRILLEKIALKYIIIYHGFHARNFFVKLFGFYLRIR